jgi:hypothetical protein
VFYSAKVKDDYKSVNGYAPEICAHTFYVNGYAPENDELMLDFSVLNGYAPEKD